MSAPFAARPENDFPLFYRTYFARCRARCPKLSAVAAKWTFEDLIPGLSDFDARFVFEDGVTLEEWHAYSLAVGEVQTEMARAFPHWARPLEHLPGLNLSVGEITDPRFYFPEFQQWTFYEGDPGVRAAIDAYLGGVAWSAPEELYHLRKVALYFGPYQRGIDPAINLGPWEGKYPLHSRYLHYFAPAVQAMVSLQERRTVCGKREALRRARALFPHPATIERALESVACHYEIADDYAEPRLTAIERELERYLADAWASLADRVTQIAVSPEETRESIGRKVAALPTEPAAELFPGVKFSRFMKGRLLFYASEIAWFDARWLIRNELGRIVALFHDQPLTAYGKLRFGETLSPTRVRERLRGDVLTPAQCEEMAVFARVAGAPLVPGREKEQARAVAAVFEPLLAALETLCADALLRLQGGR